MSFPVFYIAPGQIDDESGTVLITGLGARHMSGSMRSKKGDMVIIGDGTGASYTVTLQKFNPGCVEGRIESAMKVAREKPEIVLVQPITRPSRMDTTVLRAAEAGVSRIVPVLSPRSHPGGPVKCTDRTRRWRRIAFEASKVARRAWTLEVGETIKWPPEKEVIEGQQVNLVLWEDESARRFEDALPPVAPDACGLVVGPEGGFSEEDVSELEEMGCVPVSMGKLVLRAESAGSNAAMLIRYQYSLLNPGGMGESE